MGGSGTRSCVRTDHESCELSEHHCGSVAPLHGVCLPNWKWNLPAGQRPMSQGSDCAGVVRGEYCPILLQYWTPLVIFCYGDLTIRWSVRRKKVANTRLSPMMPCIKAVPKKR
ncbi:hypothetical protein AVEN_236605-1 [Araneus ventricosus]|uniref:Uncharacterized protein n=1 Tax=Araneus ventricosus TaxID=182803 RepID=A0A4Y2Q3J7_ARAVE|nr:hypothetical protein AVEN_236605-1 [Araneus ventricosus]